MLIAKKKSGPYYHLRALLYPASFLVLVSINADAEYNKACRSPNSDANEYLDIRIIIAMTTCHCVSVVSHEFLWSPGLNADYNVKSEVAFLA